MMTLEETVELVNKLDQLLMQKDYLGAEHIIKKRLSEVVTVEREACAKAVEDFGHSNGRIRASHKHAARAIRARTE